METVSVLIGVDRVQHGVHVDVRRERQLDDKAGTTRILVEPANGIKDALLRHVGREVDPDRVDSDLSTVTVLARYIRVRPGVLSYEDSAESRLAAEPFERRDARAQRLLNVAGSE